MHRLPEVAGLQLHHGLGKVPNHAAHDRGGNSLRRYNLFGDHQGSPVQINPVIAPICLQNRDLDSSEGLVFGTAAAPKSVAVPILALSGLLGRLELFWNGAGTETTKRPHLQSIDGPMAATMRTI